MARLLLVVLVFPAVPVLLAMPVLPVVPVLLAAPVSVDACEPQPAPIAPISVTIARAASGLSFLVVIAPSLGRGWGRRTWPGNLDPWPRGAARSARARWRRSGRARTRRRARRATPPHRRARCRWRPPRREERCRGWPPIGRLPLQSRTSTRPLGAGAPDRPRNASRC